MKTPIARTLCILAAALAMNGCMLDFGLDGWDSSDDDGYYYGGSTSGLQATDGQLYGEMGSVAVDGDARVYEATDWGYGFRIELRANGAGGAGMNRLDFDGVSVAELEPGTYEGRGYTSSSAGDPNVQVTGCSGSSEGDWTYDVGAEEVVVVVTELDDETLQIDWTATFPETSDWTTGEPIGAAETTGSVVVVR